MNSTTEVKARSLTPEELPYTNPPAFSRYITDTGKILPRKYTGLSARQQRAVTSAIKRARDMLVMQ